MQVDATGVHNRATHKSMEAKIGIIFSERAHISKNRIELIDKTPYASLQEANIFGEKFSLLCWKEGVYQAKEVVFISDGAEWIKRFQEDYLPGAVYLLDQ